MKQTVAIYLSMPSQVYQDEDVTVLIMCLYLNINDFAYCTY